MAVFEELEKRGLVDNITSPALKEKLAKGGLTFYIGFDPTADSYHVGNLAVFNVMRFLAKAGHKPMALVGGATGMIGDPGGRSKERNLLTSEKITENIAGQKKQLQKFLTFDGEASVEFLNNYDWLKDWSFLDFLREVGKHFSVNQMITRDSVRLRLEREGAGISYTEFSYMLLQAYDFYHLAKTKNCELQLGGSDQWGNIVSGVDLCRRFLQKETYGLTFPLITKADGSKFGKSQEGNIWLDPKKTSPYEFYQYFLRTEDVDVLKLLKVLTDMPFEEISALEKSLKEEAHLRKPQKALAEHLTKFVHGETELTKVMQASQVLFGQKISDLDDQTLKQIFKDVPSLEISEDKLAGEWKLIDALAESGACRSKSEARKLLSSGGVYLNNERVSDVDMVLTKESLASESCLVLRTGKKNYRLILVV